MVLGGIEAGNNFSNALDKDRGSAGVFRIRTGVNPYVVFKPGKRLLKNVKGSAFWEARFLGNEKIDPGELDERGQPTLSRRARQHLRRISPSG